MNRNMLKTLLAVSVFCSLLLINGCFIITAILQPTTAQRSLSLALLLRALEVPLIIGAVTAAAVNIESCKNCRRVRFVMVATPSSYFVCSMSIDEP